MITFWLFIGILCIVVNVASLITSNNKLQTILAVTFLIAGIGIVIIEAGKL